MSKLLQQAIERVRQLPEEEQDMAAAELIGYLSDFPTPEERIAIGEGRRLVIILGVTRRSSNTY
jgi:hypothetical protein